MKVGTAQGKSLLDPVTFEVLKNAFVNLVDQMDETVLKTCYSFAIYAHDFSSCITDRDGDTVTQGTQDLAAHVGTLHFTVKSCLQEIGRENIFPGDVIIFNDPFRGGTHFPDVRIVRPVFYDGELIAFTVICGHWSDVGGSVPGSFDIEATEFYPEGMRIPPTKIVEEGRLKEDVFREITSNMRVSLDRAGDLRAQLEASRIGAEYLISLCDRYGRDTVLEAFEELKGYVERMMRQEIRQLPKGEYEVDEFTDQDPGREKEGLIRVHITLKITDEEIVYDLTGTDPQVDCFLNGTFSSSYSAVLGATKMIFPHIPFNSGLFRLVRMIAPEGTLVNAREPAAVAGFAAGSFEKIINGSLACWAKVRPERSMGTCYCLEYVLLGGLDKRPLYRNRPFIWYDWLSGGWGGRHGKDGPSPLSPIFGVGLSNISIEVRERVMPVQVERLQILADSAGPGKWRGGLGTEMLTKVGSTSKAILSYCSDRERAIVQGVFGGGPGFPHGVILNSEKDGAKHLGVYFSNLKLKEGDSFWRPSSGGGGWGDPLDRDSRAILEDVKDGYVSVERAQQDYGMVVEVVDEEAGKYEVDEEATAREREHIRAHRRQWLEEDAEKVRAMVAEGQVTSLDAIRRYGVIMDPETLEVLTETTRVFRETLKKTTVPYWT